MLQLAIASTAMATCEHSELLIVVFSVIFALPMGRSLRALWAQPMNFFFSNLRSSHTSSVGIAPIPSSHAL